MILSRGAVALVNGSIRGSRGNTARYLSIAADELDSLGFTSVTVHLHEDGVGPGVDAVLTASAVIFGSGTYWDAWGHPLQAWLEGVTPHELSDAILGKPAGVVITADNIGGLGLLTRFQGTLSHLGFLIPPCSGIVLSRVGQVVIDPRTRTPEDSGDNGDVWRARDVRLIARNVTRYEQRGGWERWGISEVANPSWPEIPA